MSRQGELYLIEIIKRMDIIGPFLELDPIFSLSPASTILSSNITNWNDAFSWGDHSTFGYLTSETDPIFSASPSASITANEQLALANTPSTANASNPYATTNDITNAPFVLSVIQGTNTLVDITDPKNPIISTTQDPTFNGVATFNLGIFVDGNIGVTGTVDGRDIFLDGLKLDTALQPADVASVAISGNHSDLTLNDGTNPHGTTQTDVGLGNVDNTTDINKPLSTPTESFILANCDRYSSISSPTLTTSTLNTDQLISGMTLTPGAGSYIVTFNSEYNIQGGNVTGQSALDLTTAYNALMSMPDVGGGHVPAFGSNEILYAGVYTIAGAGSLTGNINLDAQGDSNAIFIIRCGAAFAITAGSTVTLVNNAQSCNVFWMSQAAITTGATSQLKGNLIVNGAAGSITFGAGASLEGKALATNGLISISNNVITNTLPCPSVNFGMVDDFVLFTTNGDVTNSLVSVINGDIGTNNGLITGFGTAVVNGTTYLPGVHNNAIVFFSVYQNGTLVPNSSRRRELDINTVDITLDTIATVLDGESIDIRYRIDSGTVSCGNKILTLKNIR